MAAERPPASGTQPNALPPENRGWLISAISILLGFSLAFFRFWSFEAEGDWAPLGIAAAVAMAAGVLLQTTALFRALRLSETTVDAYGTTVLCFLAGVLSIFFGLILGILAYV